MEKTIIGWVSRIDNTDIRESPDAFPERIGTWGVDPVYGYAFPLSREELANVLNHDPVFGTLGYNHAESLADRVLAAVLSASNHLDG